MRTWIMLLVSGGLAGAVAGQTSVTSDMAGTASEPRAAGKAAPGAAKKEEPPPKIEGVEVSRGDKGYLGVQIVDGRFKLNFYDAKKKPATPDVARAMLRWDPKYQIGPERVFLSVPAENALTSERVIKPPYSFKLFITLLKDSAAGEQPEIHTIDFRQ